MQLVEMAQTWVPVIFIAGGAYAVFKWRLNKVEDAVEKMANSCTMNRTVCTENLQEKLDNLVEQLHNNFAASANDRDHLKDALHKLDVDVARIDQRLLNGGK